MALKLFAFNAFTGASQGGAGNAGCSDITPLDTAIYSTRTAKVAAAMAPSISGISYNIPWEAVESTGPVGGVHTYDWTILDQALVDMANFPGAQCLFRVIGGSGNGSPNWLLGGGTGRLLTDMSSSKPSTFIICNNDGDNGISSTGGSAPTATTLTDLTKNWAVNAWAGMHLATGASTTIVASNTATALTFASWTGGTPAGGLYYGFGSFPTALQFDPTGGNGSGQSVTINGKPGPQENVTVTSYTAATGTLITSGGVNNNHYTGQRVEWTKTPVAYAGGAAYNQGDIVIAPRNSVIAGFGPIGGVTFVCTVPIASAPTNFTTANALSTPTMCMSAVFNDTNTMPVPWDPGGVLLSNRQLLIAAMAARYGNNTTVYAIQMAGGGYLGEMGLRPGDTAQQSTATWMPVGYTDRRFSDTWKTIVSYYASGFTSTNLILDLDESFGQSMVWPTAVAGGTFNCHANATIDTVGGGTGSTAALVVGMLVQELDGTGNAVTTHIPPNSYVGIINSATSFGLSSSQSANVPITAATTGGTPVAVQFNSTSRTVSMTTVTGSATVTATGITHADTSKLLSGTVGGWTVPAKTYVGDTVAGGFKMSSSRTHQADVVAGGAGGTAALVLAFDGEVYSGAGVTVVEIAGQNSGGTLGGSNGDIYSNPVPPGIVAQGSLGATYPNRIAVQQNGLRYLPGPPPAGDFQKLPNGRWRQIMAGAGGVTGPTTKATLGIRNSGYQFGTGSSTLTICQNCLQVAADDQCDGIEIYTVDIVAYPSLMVTFGTPLLTAPTVTAVSPNFGPVAGGTTVTISGTQFTNSSTVLFGAVPASGVVFGSSNSLTAVSPAGVAGVVDVRVINLVGTSPTSAADQFTYIGLAQPAVGSVTPNSGPQAGGTVVTIIGSGFTGASVVAFGTSPATSFVVNSDSSITATSPSVVTAGVRNVFVTGPGGTSPISAGDHFTYIGTPTTGPSPVLVTSWLDPPLQGDFQVGQAVTWHATFTDSVSHALVDPDVVTFSYTTPPANNTPTVIAYTKDTVGRYHVSLALAAPGAVLLNVAATTILATATGNSSMRLQVYPA